MTTDLDEIERELMKLLVERQGLGGFDVNASAIITLTEALLRVVQVLRHPEPPKRARK